MIVNEFIVRIELGEQKYFKDTNTRKVCDEEATESSRGDKERERGGRAKEKRKQKIINIIFGL